MPFCGNAVSKSFLVCLAGGCDNSMQHVGCLDGYRMGGMRECGDRCYTYGPGSSWARSSLDDQPVHLADCAMHQRTSLTIHFVSAHSPITCGLAFSSIDLTSQPSPLHNQQEANRHAVSDGLTMRSLLGAPVEGTYMSRSQNFMRWGLSLALSVKRLPR